MKRRDLLGALGAAGLAGACAGAVPPEGHAEGATKGPLDGFHLYLCAFHVAKKDPSFVVEAHHYCSPVGDDVHQCVIFDSADGGRAPRILGVEYIIGDALYRKLPDVEKRYYHPHTYEILSGELVAPGLDGADEDRLMGGLLTTWGKTWHTWPDPSATLPMGEPLLMWSASKDGQVPASAIEARDRRLGISTPRVRRRRAGLGPVPRIEPPRSLDEPGRQFTGEGPDVPPARP